MGVRNCWDHKRLIAHSNEGGDSPRPTIGADASPGYWLTSLIRSGYTSRHRVPAFSPTQNGELASYVPAQDVGGSSISPRL
jgi:hypothetical protein